MNSVAKRQADTKGATPERAAAQSRTDLILDAATTVFLDQGYSRASTREIARLVGISKETLYQHFPTKASLFVGLMERKSTELFASMENLATSGTTDPYGSLSDFSECLLRLLLNPETQQLHHVVIAESIEFPDLATAFWEKGPGRSHEMLELYLKRLIQDARMKTTEVTFASQQFFGALLGGVLLRSTLGIASFLQNEASQKHWVKSNVEAFIRAYDIKSRSTKRRR